MSRISPFVGLLFDRSRVGSLDEVTAPPYDVVSEAERLRYLNASPYNVIRLDLGEERPGVGQVEDKYRRAASELRSWRDQLVLVPTNVPSYFAYEMRFSLHGTPRRIRGLVCAVELEDWGGSIVPHERTMKGPVQDRLEQLRAARTNLSCIHAVFRGPSAPLAAFLDAAAAGSEPHAMATDEAGVEHRLWICPPGPEVAGWLADEPLMIADGHHRYTTALRYRDEMRGVHGAGPWDQVMMLVADASVEEPPVLPFHRIQATGPTPTGGARVRDLEEVLETVSDSGLLVGVVTAHEGVVTHRVLELAGDPPAVCALHAQILTDHEDRLRFTPDAFEAEAAVRSGAAVASYLLPPTDAATIRSVVDRGDRLPQKSTFFWPKPLTGLVIRPLDP
ncbi:MAG TPA: DUF1015 domain-containing protein [Candidatus Limnocylindrales bacterium]|nr:DUF1015 domain-containing protein [Candidatus Limnocylindrales bacterium]HLA92852.1 DUF1015 domain-containing protein [Actinomycetota bacterium]